ncbi:MAG TPA: hypothetical protein VEV15_13095, partial [Flavisolibacter sp.]|nr:hypothetical protein [Flavisolibacter sp.]
TGNQVLHKGAIIIIDGIDRSNESVMVEGRHIAIPLADIEPIPLTPELLERCGFTTEWRERNIWELKGKDEDENDFRIQGNSGTFYLTPNYEEIAIGKGFHFVHQLQNIYLDLNHEELTIKETV